MRLTPAAAAFEVRDRGIGIFHSIRSKFGLEDEQAALLELVKGRTTTMPERHAGEGDVKAIGQGFADEVFRVFPGAHPRRSRSSGLPVLDVELR